jgi:hypothetical protein
MHCLHMSVSQCPQALSVWFQKDCQAACVLIDHHTPLSMGCCSSRLQRLETHKACVLPRLGSSRMNTCVCMSCRWHLLTFLGQQGPPDVIGHPSPTTLAADGQRMLHVYNIQQCVRAVSLRAGRAPDLLQQLKPASSFRKPQVTTFTPTRDSYSLVLHCVLWTHWSSD